MFDNFFHSIVGLEKKPHFDPIIKEILVNCVTDDVKVGVDHVAKHVPHFFISEFLPIPISEVKHCKSSALQPNLLSTKLTKPFTKISLVSPAH